MNKNLRPAAQAAAAAYEPVQKHKVTPSILGWLKNVWISIKISLKLVPKGLINNIPSLVQIMAWRRPGDKPLSEPMMVSLLMYICVTQPQWVNDGVVWVFVSSDLNELTHWGWEMHIYASVNLPSLFQIMACRLFSAKPLSEPMLLYCQSNPMEHISVEFYLKFKSFH